MTSQSAFASTARVRKFKVDTNDFIVDTDGTRLYTVVAQRDFGDVKAGDRGGRVQWFGNLSYEGTSWIQQGGVARDESLVYGNAVIGNGVTLKGESRIFGDVALTKPDTYTNVTMPGLRETIALMQAADKLRVA